MERKKNNQNKQQNPLKNEWVIKLVDASQKVVKGYEDYLMNRLGHRELAMRMTKLRDLLPDGFKENDKDENDD